MVEGITKEIKAYEPREKPAATITNAAYRAASQYGTPLAHPVLIGGAQVSVDRRVYNFTPEGKLICGAKKKDGTPCMIPPIKGRNRCRLHGGKTPIGIASPHFITGKFSADAPMRLSERYEQALKDERLLELRDDIALYEARMGELLKNLSEFGDSAETWGMLKTEYERATKAIRRNDQAAFSEHLKEIGLLINKGRGQWATWNEIIKVETAKRKSVESEQKHMLSKGQMMTAEQAMALMQFTVSTIRKHVREQLDKELEDKGQARTVGDKILSAISQDISAHVSNPGARR